MKMVCNIPTIDLLVNGVSKKQLVNAPCFAAIQVMFKVGLGLFVDGEKVDRIKIVHSIIPPKTYSPYQDLGFINYSLSRLQSLFPKSLQYSFGSAKEAYCVCFNTPKTVEELKVICYLTRGCFYTPLGYLSQYLGISQTDFWDFVVFTGNINYEIESWIMDSHSFMGEIKKHQTVKYLDFETYYKILKAGTGNITSDMWTVPSIPIIGEVKSNLWDDFDIKDKVLNKIMLLNQFNKFKEKYAIKTKVIHS